jgi:hypothetical protein
MPAVINTTAERIYVKFKKTRPFDEQVFPRLLFTF